MQPGLIGFKLIWWENFTNLRPSFSSWVIKQITVSPAASIPSCPSQWLSITVRLIGYTECLMRLACIGGVSRERDHQHSAQRPLLLVRLSCLKPVLHWQYLSLRSKRPAYLFVLLRNWIILQEGSVISQKIQKQISGEQAVRQVQFRTFLSTE